MAETWSFAIDVGGTFTDCLGFHPNYSTRTVKVLSSGICKARIDDCSTNWILDKSKDEVDHFYDSYHARFASGKTYQVKSFHSQKFHFEQDLDLEVGDTFELYSNEEAPVFAIRKLLALPLSSEIPSVTIRLGTTRGTNALLERKGAKIALVATSGFADLLSIGDQARLKLFDLSIHKFESLYSDVIEIDGRIDASGAELVALDKNAITESLKSILNHQIYFLVIQIVLENAIAIQGQNLV